MPKDKKLELVEDDQAVKTLTQEEMKDLFDDLLIYIQQRAHQLIDQNEVETSPFELIIKIVNETNDTLESESEAQSVTKH